MSALHHAKFIRENYEIRGDADGGRYAVGAIEQNSDPHRATFTFTDSLSPSLAARTRQPIESKYRVIVVRLYE